MTPPIPDYILTAGAMASLTTYDDRQVQTPENETVGTGAGQPQR